MDSAQIATVVPLHQGALELEMFASRRSALRKSVNRARKEGTESTTSYGSKFIREGVEPLALYLKELLTGKRRGPRSIPQKRLACLSADKIAWLSLTTALNEMCTPLPLMNLAMAVGETIQREAKAFQGEKHEPWEDDDTHHVGIFLIDAIIDRLGYLEAYDERKGKKSTKYICVRESALDTIMQHLRNEAFRHPMYLPMVEVPKKWTRPIGGGYLTESTEPLHLVKMILPEMRANYHEELASHNLDAIYTALNAIQETAWSINERILQVVNFAMAEKWERADLPTAELQPLPAKPTDPEGIKNWKRQTWEIKKENKQLASAKIRTTGAIAVAEKFLHEPQIYFPHQLDLCGRAYPVPQGLNPQGNDLERGLLRFAKGKVLGTERAAHWLAVHGANLWARDGIDKEPFDLREAWVRKHQSDILKSAYSPLECIWWTAAKNPWQFLAFCFEWSGYHAQGITHESFLPVSIDGACNGLQHYAAILRDEEGGRAVNLIPSDKPNDIYQTVADKTTRKLVGDPTEIAKKWLEFGVSRELTKKPVMTTAYGISLWSCKKQVRDKTLKLLNENTDLQRVFPKDEEGRFDIAAPCSYLGQLLWETIGETAVAAIGAMGWLTDVAKVYNEHAGVPLVWLTPTGFPVLQAKEKWRTIQIQSRFQRKTYRPKIQKVSGHLNKDEMASAFAPNFVHSLDAAHMVLTINRCVSKGIKDFAMVHDSYGTYAADIDTLRDELREAFYAMYADRDILGDLKQQLAAGLRDDADKLPEPPKCGSLDLSGVLKSDYLFA